MCSAKRSNAPKTHPGRFMQDGSMWESKRVQIGKCGRFGREAQGNVACGADARLKGRAWLVGGLEGWLIGFG